MALIRKLVDGERFSSTNKENVRCAACKRDAEYQKVGVMQGQMDVCHKHTWLPVWQVVGMKHTVIKK